MKSKVIEDLVNDEATITQSLRKLQVIAHDLKNKELEAWAESELVGYKNGADIPEYRTTYSTNFIYSGINGGYKIEKAPLELGFLGKEVLEEIIGVNFGQSVDALEAFLRMPNDSILLDRSKYADAVDKNSGGGVQCLAIGQIIPKSFFQDALAEIRNRTLKSLLLLEDQFGNLDGVGIDVSKYSELEIRNVNREINSDVLKIEVESLKETIPSKIWWKIIVPIIATVIGTIIGSVAILVIQKFIGM